MKNLLLIITLFISCTVFSQKTEALQTLEDSFKADTSFYDLLLKSNGTTLIENENDNQTIVFDLGSDDKSDFQKITYSFEKSSLSFYTILFKDDRNLSLDEFCELYGDCDEKIIENNIYTWGAGISKLYAKFITNTNELIIGLK